MMQLHQDKEKLEQKDTKILVVGPEKAQKFEAYWKEHNLEFTGISDEKKQVLGLFGQKVNLFKLGRMPAQILVDKEGTVRYVHYGHSMKDIPETDEVLELIDKL